jgi:hypothetical protein
MELLVQCMAAPPLSVLRKRGLSAAVNAGGSDDVRQAYQSWRGNYRRRFNAYNQVRYMDRLYNSLFIKQP